MPGHRVKRSDVKNATLFEKYQCPHCHLLLKNAVQPLCGHWLCESCADNLLCSSSSPKCPRPDCQEDLKSDDADEGPEYFPDRFVRREIEGLVVSCPHRLNGCQWEAKLGNYGKHLMTCQFASQSCLDCGETMTIDKMQSHKRVCPKAKVQCPLAGLGCQHTQFMIRDELEEHILTHGVEHLAVIGKVLKLLKLSLLNNEPKKVPGQDMDDNIEYDPGAYQDPQMENNFSQKQSEMAGDGPLDWLRSEDLYKVIVGLLHKYISLMSKNEDNQKLKDHLSDLMRMILLENQNSGLSLTEYINCDGSIIWKIPQFSQRMADAQSGRYTSIFSLPFYTGRYGYKMCLRLYILGDGIGKNTHMSLFFVIMKGEFDSILQWPFTHKVAFKLINQTGSRDIIATLQPDPMSSSFHKPKSDMNVASGCPQFISHTQLENNGFIIDDTVFIKCSVDCSFIKYP